MSTYSFTLRGGLTLSDASVVTGAGRFDIDAALISGSGTITTTDDELAAALRGVLAPGGVTLLIEGGVTPGTALDRRQAIPVFLQGDEPTTATYEWIKTNGAGVPTGVIQVRSAEGTAVLSTGSGGSVASAVTVTPAGTIAATDVQAALVEVAGEAAQKSANLSDLASAATARTNLGLGSAATQASTVFAPVATSGLLSARPTATGSKAQYTATDDAGGTTYLDTASGTWTPIAGPVTTVLSGGPSYGMTPTAFPKWRKALAKQRAGVANAKILFAGDSTTAGKGGVLTATNYPSIFESLMNSYYAPTQDGAIWGVNTALTDPRVVKGTGWVNSTVGGPAMWGGGGWSATTAATGALSFTFPHSIDTIDVCYITFSGNGSVTVNVDGGASLGTINTNASSGVAKQTVTCTAGTHTINITAPTGGTVFILSVEAYLSTAKRVIVSNAGADSARTSDWVDTSIAWYGYNVFPVYQPDLTVISLGINDAGASVSDTTFAANLTTLINRAKTYGDVLLVAPVPSQATAPWSTYEPLYIVKCKSLATTLGVGFIDMSARWVDWNTSNALGFYFDSLHPSATGYADWANAVFNALKTV